MVGASAFLPLDTSSGPQLLPCLCPAPLWLGDEVPVLLPELCVAPPPFRTPPDQAPGRDERS